MGKAISYCSSCQTQIREADFAKGSAFHIEERAFCQACSGEAIKSVAPEKVGALLKEIAAQARKAAGTPASSKSLPIVPDLPPRPRPAPRNNSMVLMGAAGGAVVLVGILVFAFSGTTREPAPEKPAAPVVETKAKPVPDKGVAAYEALAAFAAASTDPQAILQRCLEARPELRGTKYEARLEEIEKRAKDAWDRDLKDARFKTFLQSVATMRADDPGFQRRGEIRSLINSGRAAAGSNKGAVEQLLADYDRAFLDAAKSAAENIQLRAAEFAAQGRFRAAAAALDEYPASFRETEFAKPVSEARAAHQRKAEDAARAEAEAARADADRRKAVWSAWKAAADQSTEFLPAWGDRTDVQRLRPAAGGKPCSLEREFEIPPGKGAVIGLWAGREEGRPGWTLKVIAGGKALDTVPVGPDGRIWKPVLVDLTPVSGKKIVIRLEALDLAPEAEPIYMSNLDVRIVADAAAAASMIAKEQDPLTGWTISCSSNNGFLPLILPEFRGRPRVVETHPFSEQKPGTVERDVTIPAKRRAMLSFWVTHAHDADWELRVLVEGTLLKKELVGGDDAWRQYTFDLSAHAGKTVRISLQNAANNWSSEFAYWSDVAVTVGD
ncbi:MAG TPA: hypothetical protein VE981_01630 [Planctomycetota bacterium]|nr:hypothetical protein [Planctomycetota bacterium]